MRTRLRFEIALTLLVKLAALTALYLLFFAPAHRPAVSAAAVAHHLYASPHQGVAR